MIEYPGHKDYISDEDLEILWECLGIDEATLVDIKNNEPTRFDSPNETTKT